MSIRLRTNRSPFRWVLLVLLFSLILAACGGDEPETPVETPAAAGTGQYRFLYFRTDDCGAQCEEMDPSIEKFATDYSGKLSVETIDGNSEDGKKMMADYSLTKIPSYVILGPDGAKLWSNSGPMHKDMLNQQIIGLLPK